MSNYTHLTTFERENILYFRAQGKSISFIALKLNRSKSTISRELKRNSFNGDYWPDQAQKVYSARRKNSHPHYRFEDLALFSFVRRAFLEWQWSPQQIAERLRINALSAIQPSIVLSMPVYLIHQSNIVLMVVEALLVNCDITVKAVIQKIMRSDEENSMSDTLSRNDRKQPISASV